MGTKREEQGVRLGEEGGEVIEEERKVSVKKMEGIEEGGRDIIRQKLNKVQESYEEMIRVMDRLQGRCIYCGLIYKIGLGVLHKYSNYSKVEKDGYGRE